MLPLGKPHLYHVQEAAGVDEHVVRPPEGFEWLFNYLFFYHNSPDDETGYWYVYDDEKGINGYITDVTLSTYEKLYFPHYYQYSVGQEFKLTRDFYLKCKADVDNDKNLIIRGMYIERPQDFDILLEQLKGIGAYHQYQLPIDSRV